MKPSRRDSNRTKGDFLRLTAVQAIRDGQTEDQFVANIKPEYQELARKAYRDAVAFDY